MSPSIYSRRPLLRGVLLAAATGLAVFVAFALSMYIAGEQTEVAVLRTFDAGDRWYGVVVRTQPIPVRLDPDAAP